jgi:hypothetical protein
VLPAGHGDVFTEHSFVAEAVPAPNKAIVAIAATRQRPIGCPHERELLMDQAVSAVRTEGLVKHYDGNGAGKSTTVRMIRGYD